MANIVDTAIERITSLGEQVQEAIEDAISDVISKPSQEIKIEDLLEEDKRLQYPLHDVTKHQMYVTFQTLVQQNIDLQKAVDDVDSRQQSTSTSLLEFLPSRKQTIQDNFVQVGVKDKRSVAFNGGQAQNVANLKAAFANAKLVRKPPQPGGTIIRLYIPAQLQYQDGMQYNNISLGVIGATAEAAINAGMNLNVAEIGFESIGTGISSLIEGITSSLDTDLGAVAAQRAARKSPVAADKLVGAIQGATQTTVNPNNRTLFEGVATRTFAFSFGMIAQSKEEAEQIESIVKHFRTEMYPSEILAVKGEDFEIPVGYNFPKKWQIKFWDNYTGQEVFHKIRPAFLTNANVTYNSGESTFHEDGKPTSVEITLTFMEDRPLARKDIKEGY